MAKPTLSSINSSSSNGSVTITWQTDTAAESYASVFFGPAKHCTWNWQLTGTIDTTAPADVYDFDAFDNSASLVTQLRNRGTYTVAYFSGGSYENWRSDQASFPVGVRGSDLDGWEGEKWLDTRQLSVLRPIMAARADIAKSKGFDAIEWDNVDVHTQQSGFNISPANQLAYNKMLAEITHERGMAVFLKNDPEQVAALEPFFDGSIAEEAYTYNEADDYLPFATANKPVLICEYDNVSVANQNDANAKGFSVIRHNLNLNSKYLNSYVVNPAAPIALGGNAVTQNLTAKTNHSLTLTGLTAGQTYRYLVWSKNADGTTYDVSPRTFIASGTGSSEDPEPNNQARYFALNNSWTIVPRQPL